MLDVSLFTLCDAHISFSSPVKQCWSVQFLLNMDLYHEHKRFVLLLSCNVMTQHTHSGDNARRDPNGCVHRVKIDINHSLFRNNISLEWRDLDENLSIYVFTWSFFNLFWPLVWLFASLNIASDRQTPGAEPEGAVQSAAAPLNRYFDQLLTQRNQMSSRNVQKKKKMLRRKKKKEEERKKNNVPRRQQQPPHLWAN